MELLRSSGASATEIAQVSPHEDPRILVADEQTMCVVIGPVWVERGRKLHARTDTHMYVYTHTYIYIYLCARLVYIYVYVCIYIYICVCEITIKP